MKMKVMSEENSLLLDRLFVHYRVVPDNKDSRCYRWNRILSKYNDRPKKLLAKACSKKCIHRKRCEILTVKEIEEAERELVSEEMSFEDNITFNIYFKGNKLPIILSDGDYLTISEILKKINLPNDGTHCIFMGNNELVNDDILKTTMNRDFYVHYCNLGMPPDIPTPM